jgi:hypothetical protein
MTNSFFAVEILSLRDLKEAKTRLDLVSLTLSAKKV